MAKNLVSGPILDSLPPLGRKPFFTRILLLLDVRLYCMLSLYAISKKSNERKSSFRPDFGLFWPKLGHQKRFWWVLLPLDVIHCCQLSSYKISSKTIEQNLRK